MACPSGRSPGEFGHSRKTVRQVLKHAEPNPQPSTRDRSAPAPGAGPGDHRPDPGRRRERPAQAAAHRRPGLPAPPRRARLPRRLRPGPTLPAASTDAGIGRRSSPWAISRANASKPISATSTSISPTAAGSSRSWSPPGPTPTPPSSWPCPSSAPRRSSKAWSPPSSSSARVPKEVWWDNPRTVATLILQGRERQLHPRYAALASHYVFDPALLHAGPRQREARRRGDRQGRAEAVRHARAARRRPR